MSISEEVFFLQKLESSNFLVCWFKSDPNMHDRTNFSLHRFCFMAIFFVCVWLVQSKKIHSHTHMLTPLHAPSLSLSLELTQGEKTKIFPSTDHLFIFDNLVTEILTFQVMTRAAETSLFQTSSQFFLSLLDWKSMSFDFFCFFKRKKVQKDWRRRWKERPTQIIAANNRFPVSPNDRIEKRNVII